MKSKLVLLALLLSATSFAQNVPIKFSNNRDDQQVQALVIEGEAALLNDTLFTDHYLIDVKGSLNKKKFMDTIFYRSIAVIAAKKADSLEAAIKFSAAQNIKKTASELGGTNDSKILNDMNDLEEQMKKQLARVDYLRTIEEEYKYKTRTAHNLNLFAVHKSTDAQLFYNAVASDKTAQFLNNTLVSFSADGGRASIYNEIYSDFYGPVRFGMGVLLSNKETKIYTDSTSSKVTDSTSYQKDAMQRLLGGGGNASFNANYPFLKYHNSRSTFFLKLSAGPKIGIDVPKLGTESKDYSVNYDLGVEGNIYYVGALNNITVFSSFRFGYIGGNSLFYTNLLKNDNAAFSFNNVSIGLALKSTFRISWSYYFGDPFVTSNFPSTISFTIIPN